MYNAIRCVLARMVLTWSLPLLLVSASAFSMSSPQPKIKAVIFDLDGTLLDTETPSCAAVLDAFGPSLSQDMREMLRQTENYRLPWELKKRTLGLRGSAWIPMVIDYATQHWNVRSGGENEEQKDGNDGDLPPLVPSVSEFWNRWEVRLCELCVNVEECRGATELVQKLYERGIPLAIATSSRALAVEKKRIKHEAMFQCIPTIVCGDDPAIKRGKPAPDIYLETAQRLGIDPVECLCFEDAVAGVESAKRAGMKVIAVPDPRMEPGAFIEARADEVIESMEDFDYKKWGLT